MSETSRTLRSRPRKNCLRTLIPERLVWPLIGVLLSLGLFLLWLGQAIVVRTERKIGGNVDVTVERRFLGVIPTSRETMRNLGSADAHYIFARSGAERGSTVALQLTSRDGPVLLRTRFGPSLGTRPQTVAAKITQFLRGPGLTITGPSLTLWWMPWLVNLAAILLLIFPIAVIGELALRALGSSGQKRAGRQVTGCAEPFTSAVDS